MILLKIYITGVIAGLIFPVVDDLLNNRSKIYREVGSDSSNEMTKIYRLGPFHYKLLAAFIPVFNLLWVIVLILIVRLYILDLIINIKVAIIKKLAKHPKKRFLLKFWIVKHIFPGYKEFFYTRVEMSLMEGQNTEEIIKRQLDLIDQILKSEREDSKTEEHGPEEDK